MARTLYETAIVVREIKTTGDLNIMRKTIRCGSFGIGQKDRFPCVKDLEDRRQNPKRVHVTQSILNVICEGRTGSFIT